MTLEFSRTNRHHALRRLRQLLLIGALSLLVACGGTEEQQTEIQSLTEAYERARESMTYGNYRRAILIFEAIQARYPFSDLSRQIQLELMYSYYKSGQTERAIEAAETFQRENPIHPRVDYALYIMALSYFEGDGGFLERWFRRDLTRRPPTGIIESYMTLRRLVERYPASPYAADAEQRMIFLRDWLASYENHVADYYIRRGAYIAALNRAKSSLEQFHGSIHNARSLELMIAAYDAMGMTDLAADTRRVLEMNYPES